MVAMKHSAKTQYAILGMLSISPMSGYEMRKRMNESTNHFWSESSGQLYPTCNKLEQAKLAKCTVENIGAKQRKTYSITPKGKRHLRDWLKQEITSPTHRNELLLKLFFGSECANQHNINHLLDKKRNCEKELKTYAGIKEKLSKSTNKRAPYWLITLNYGIKTTQAELAWCNETLKTLSKINQE